MTASDYVVYACGFTLPLAAFRLAWELEERGLQLGVDGDTLTVRPGTHHG